MGVNKTKHHLLTLTPTPYTCPLTQHHPSNIDVADDVDTELLRQLAAKAMQVCKADRGKKNWAKQNGNVAATLPPDFR